jgi:hypothetical protein
MFSRADGSPRCVLHLITKRKQFRLTKLLGSLRKSWSSVARRPWIAAAVLFALPVVLRLSILGSYPKPHPMVHDEFGHLLLADTLRYRRFANPPHALSDFFDAIYIVQHPVYSATYPPGQAFMLFAGRLLFGDPWAGVVLINGVLCVAVWWALRGWVTPGWALLGGLFVFARVGLFGDWMNSYWGGSLAGVVGSLVFGGLPRLERALRARSQKADREILLYAFLLGTGLGFHFLIRPFETVSLGLCAAAYLVVRGTCQPQNRLFRSSRLLLKLIAAASAPILCALAISVVQNYQVTGDWRKMPYMLTREQYGVPQTFTFQKPAIPSLPLRQEQRANYEVQLRHHNSTIWARIKERVYLMYFDAGLGLTISLALAVLAVQDERFRWALGMALLPLVCSLTYGYFFTHYVSGFISIWMVLPLLGLEYLSRIEWAGRPVGVLSVILLSILILNRPVRVYTAYFLREVLPENMQRGFIATTSDDLVLKRPWFMRLPVENALRGRGGRHLVFVTELPSARNSTLEWVYNAADIDSSPIVWAHSLGVQRDEDLKRYYGSSRSVWIVSRDIGISTLKPY